MKYPGGVKLIQHINNNALVKENTFQNRGMTLEYEINLSNEYYRDIDKAIIYKKPTPIKLVKVDYPSRDKATIREAYFATPSTTDYNGIYNGMYIDFEAKETKSKTSFSLANIHPHQLNHLKRIYNHSGIAFLIIRFTSLNETYLLLEETLDRYLTNSNKKSIPIDFFRKEAYLIEDGYNPRIDYLKVIDKIIGGK